MGFWCGCGCLCLWVWVCGCVCLCGCVVGIQYCGFVGVGGCGCGCLWVCVVGLWQIVFFFLFLIVLFLPGNTAHHGPRGSRGLAPWYETGRTPERRGKKTANKERRGFSVLVTFLLPHVERRQLRINNWIGRVSGVDEAWARRGSGVAQEWTRRGLGVAQTWLRSGSGREGTRQTTCGCHTSHISHRCD